MTIAIKNIFKESGKFNLVGIICLVIQIPTQLIIGVSLKPSEYGIISFVSLWSLYAGFINPGMLSASLREIPYLIGQKDFRSSLKVQNISISSDFIYSLCLFLIIICASFFYQSRIIKIGLIFTALSFISNRILNYWASINFVKQRFTVVAFGRLLGTILSQLFIVISIYWFGIYSVLTAPLISAIIMIVYYMSKGPINFCFSLDWPETRRLIKIGFAFTVSAVFFYGFRLVDRTIIASFFSLSDLGLFSFALGFILYGLNFSADFGRVLEPILWEYSGMVEDKKTSFLGTKKMAIYIALLISIAIPFSQLVYILVVRTILSKYIGSAILFIILSHLLYFGSMAMLPCIILNSNIVNKQALVSFIYGLGICLNIFLDLIMIHFKFSVLSIAIASIFAQFLVTSILYYFAFEYVFKYFKDLLKFSFYIFLPLAVCFLLSYFNANIVLSSNKLIKFTLFSFSLQIIAWGSIGFLFYRNVLENIFQSLPWHIKTKSGIHKV